jgi:adenine/guanine phosphoribosyltransferase-like PRPP-binding protein
MMRASASPRESSRMTFSGITRDTALRPFPQFDKVICIEKRPLALGCPAAAKNNCT